MPRQPARASSGRYVSRLTGGALDLQARIAAEQVMLQNEQTKLQVLYQATQAQESSMRQQARERVIEEHGRFETRFQPSP